MTHVHQEMTRYRAAFILALADFHARGLAKERGAPSTQIWLRRHLGIAESTAWEYLRLGKLMHEFELAGQAFLDGEIGYTACRLISAHLTCDNEQRLVELARTLTLTELEAVLAGADKADKQPRQESFHLGYDDEGWLTGSFRLNPEHGAALKAALKIAELASIRGLEDIDPEVLADDDALDEALAEAEKTPEAAPAENPPASGFGAPLRQHMLGAFLSMTSMVRSNPTSPLRAPGTQVNLMMTEDGRPYMPENPAARAPDLVAAAFNGMLRAHMLDSDGTTIMVSRPRRLASDLQVRALVARWGFQCAMPGCNHSRFLEMHHIVCHHHGGPTAVWNMMPLCAACHSLVTAGVVIVELDDRDRSMVYFRFPDGTTFFSKNRSTPMILHRGGFEEVEETKVLALTGDSFDDAEFPAAEETEEEPE
ncbi:HNH endonuclease signature motif containing protein [Corynebacterium yudongzhengii]|nr:HNH endonuclease signature motif containing protein [Corynebacterium yudongzhengii]